MPSKIKHVSSAKDVQIHSLPCKIHANDKAEVSRYFDVKKTLKDGEEVLTSSFRGFPLDGKDIPVPAGFSGIVLDVDDTCGQSKNHKCSGTFDRFTYWNWNKKPSRNDALIAALDWIDVSAAINDPTDS